MNTRRAVNSMLQSINELPLETTQNISDLNEATLADALLEDTKRNMLTEGFHFNSDAGWSLNINASNLIMVPDNVLSIDSSSGLDIIYKESKLYNKTTQSYLFEEAHDCDIVWDIPFEDVPETYAVYIVKKASRIFYARIVGVDSTYTTLQTEEAEARAGVQKENMRTGDYNVFTGAFASDLISLDQ